jgi:hypothetical protein
VISRPLIRDKCKKGITFSDLQVICCEQIDLKLYERAFISIERKIYRAALLPVRAFISFPLICFPYGEKKTGGTRFSIDMISLTGNE